MTTQERLTAIIDSLDKVTPDTKQMIFDMAQSLPEMEIIQSFNQQASDLFTLIISITKKMNKENDCKVAGYKAIFDSAVRVNVKLPIDKFTLLILEFASDIYTENEDCFLNMSIPDTNIGIGNEFAIFRSEMFKKLWIQLNNSDKKNLFDNIILLTTFAHTYLYKTLIKNQSQ